MMVSRTGEISHPKIIWISRHDFLPLKSQSIKSTPTAPLYAGSDTEPMTAKNLYNKLKIL